MIRLRRTPRRKSTKNEVSWLLLVQFMLFREQNFWIWNLVLDSRAQTFYSTSTTVQSWFNLCPCIRDWQLSTICRVKSCWSWSNILWWLIYGCFEGLRDAWYTEKADTLPVNGIGPQQTKTREEYKIIWFISHEWPVIIPW